TGAPPRLPLKLAHSVKKAARCSAQVARELWKSGFSHYLDDGMGPTCDWVTPGEDRSVGLFDLKHISSTRERAREEPASNHYDRYRHRAHAVFVVTIVASEGDCRFRSGQHRLVGDVLIGLRTCLALPPWPGLRDAKASSPLLHERERLDVGVTRDGCQEGRPEGRRRPLHDPPPATKQVGGAEDDPWPALHDRLAGDGCDDHGARRAVTVLRRV